ncbi:hypothetical protein, partial [Hungatella hominis]|uniref:hypothetical protein n=1 Tax=Hungatella hominis TaxID=2763050 RepID=UPI001A9B17F2
TIIVFVLNFLIQSHQTMAYFIRIFRVLHTVQSSVFKVLCVVMFSTATRIFYHIVSVLSTTFLISFFLLFHRFSRWSYSIAQRLISVNHNFTFFSTKGQKNNHLEKSGERGI